MNPESYFISLFQNRFIGDDGAYIEGFVYSKDAFFENIHFKKEWMSHYQIAKKAMLVNISDAIAMNAKPKYALLSVAMPKSITKAQMRELAQGFRDAATQYGVEIIGGDTISNSKLDITITIISQTKRPIYRNGIKPGYLVAYTGELGKSHKDLKRLFNGAKLHKRSKFVDIRLRKRFVERSATKIAAMMDISDGLVSDLGKLASQSKIGFQWIQKPLKRVGCSGEEYEILFAFAPKKRLAITKLAKLTRTPITIVAKASRQKYINRCKAHHF
ncbi:MAG: thiamine-phosphate kinase [Epsilonproteobacteria bacterium]|nr:thiamine-phosphate kinase [Campylobacterota bacterium]